jgi:DNA-binding transcriptional MerR regulator
MSAPIKTLTIQEVSMRSGVPTHTLRFWEKELAGIIVPERTKGGQRRYTMDDLLIIEKIKDFKGNGLSLNDIKSRMTSHLNSNEDAYNQAKADILANKIAEIVRSVVFHYLEGKTEKE